MRSISRSAAPWICRRPPAGSTTSDHGLYCADECGVSVCSPNWALHGGSLLVFTDSQNRPHTPLPSPGSHQGGASLAARSIENVFHLHWCPGSTARRRDPAIVEHLCDGAQRGSAGLLCLADDRQHLGSTFVSRSLVGRDGALTSDVKCCAAEYYSTLFRCCEGGPRALGDQRPLLLGKGCIEM